MILGVAGMLLERPLRPVDHRIDRSFFVPIVFAVPQRCAFIQSPHKRRNVMTTARVVEGDRRSRRHPEELPDLLTKSQVAEYLQCSQRQVELLTQKGRICKPIYLGESSPRWQRVELLASLGKGQEGSAE